MNQSGREERRVDWSLLVCARKGHLTYAPDEPGLRELVKGHITWLKVAAFVINLLLVSRSLWPRKTGANPSRS
jgi:hypothetical protein